MNDILLSISPIQPHLAHLIENCQSKLIISSPYIKTAAAHWLLQVKPSSLDHVQVLTNLSLENILSKSLDLGALRILANGFANVSITSLPSLHAKVFIADEKIAFVTSANFTNGGLRTNYEYGVILQNRAEVQTIVQDMRAYMSLGITVDNALLDRIEEQIIKLETLQRNALKNAAMREFNKKMAQSKNEIQDLLFAKRLENNQSINSVFSKTIMMILQRTPEGVSTPELHTQVQNIHPDICDDSIDRVVNGQHFGKRWKHYVRRAQEFLREKRLIHRDNGIWRVT